MTKIILASSSPYRKAQLEQLQVDFEAHSPHVNEDLFKKEGHAPAELARILAKEKALALAPQFPQSLIIGSDQVLDFQGEVFNQPGNFDKAVEQLEKLQGQTHQLITSVCFYLPQTQEIKEVSVISRLTMRKLTSDQIQRYLNFDRPFGCCGSYRLESLGISLFKEVITPDQTSIIGLPLLAVSDFLQEKRMTALFDV